MAVIGPAPRVSASPGPERGGPSLLSGSNLPPTAVPVQHRSESGHSVAGQMLTEDHRDMTGMRAMDAEKKREQPVAIEQTSYS